MRSLTGLTILFLITICELQSGTAVEYRLSKEVIPLSYDIKITPYFLPEDGDKRFTFQGETSIIVTTTNSSIREFAVHADYLEFTKVNVFSVINEELEFTSEYETITDKLIFRLKEDMPPFVNHTLNFKYTGQIFDGYGGLYRISYAGVDGDEKWMIATQLQRIDARKLFPCFDEPGFKAHFNINISRPKNFRSFSNTALLDTSTDSDVPDRYVDHFDMTPPMSTYLVAIVVSEYVPRGEENLFILARPEYYNKTAFSYGVANDILSGYDKLFEIPYSTLGNPILQKASLSKFVHNGMENWGLMIYKDEVLIFDDGNTDLKGMQYTTTIISHETSHNWFGNSITLEWWGYFWLNEGFARYYQYFATHMLYPQYELEKQFVVDQLHLVFSIDAVNTTQPLSEPDVASPSEIANKFSSITYVKGASVIRMIYHAMSKQYFQLAINDYISNNLNRSVVPSDLLKYLSLHWPSSAVDVAEFFADWTEQVGFPMLIISAAEDNSSVTVKQKRFLANPEDGSDSNLRYTIPITFTTNAERNFDNTYPVKYFEKNLEEINFNFTEPIQWVMFNIQQSGYYRVMYNSTNLWNNLQDALYKDDWSGIHELNRAQFIDDLLAFAKADLIEYDLVFKWFEYLETETEYIPWAVAFKGFAFIGQYLTVGEHGDLGKYILFVTEKVFTKLGVTGKINEPVLDIYNRQQVLNFNCKYGRRTCTEEIQKILWTYLDSGTDIPVDSRSTVYCNGMRDASEVDFDKLLKIFISENVQSEKLRIRYGLGCGRYSKNIVKFFDLILSDEIPVEDKESAMAPLYEENPENVWPVYQMVTTRVDDVARAFGTWSTTASLISSIATLLTTEEQRDNFEEFVATNRDKFGTSSETLDKAIQTLDRNLEWAENRLGSLREFLKSRNGVAATKLINVFVLVLAALSYDFF